MQSAIDRYKTVKVKTSSPGEIVVMLYDGIYRFLTEAKVALDAGDRARFGDRLDRAHAIVSELLTSLRPEHAPELCAQLTAIYHFCMDCIVEANLKQDVGKIDDVMRALAPLRDAWRQVAGAPQALDVATP
jgi:flagellar protein FliS